MNEKIIETTTKKNEWTPNEKQKLFLKLVKENPGKTLAELSELGGVKFTSGCINVLCAKGLVNNEKEVKVPVQTFRKVKVYELVEQEK